MRYNVVKNANSIIERNNSYLVKKIHMHIRVNGQVFF